MVAEHPERTKGRKAGLTHIEVTADDREWFTHLRRELAVRTRRQWTNPEVFAAIRKLVTDAGKLVEDVRQP
jgi:hypothetical protein